MTTLLEDHELSARTLRTAVDRCAELNDVGMADFLTHMLQGHEQMAWIHRSFLEGEAIQPNGETSVGSFPHGA